MRRHASYISSTPTKNTAPTIPPTRVYNAETMTTSGSGGQKGTKQARFDLIPWDFIWELALLYGKGAEKYADRNWERGYEASKSFAALQRHLIAWFQTGEEIDPELGVSHLAAVAFHAAQLYRISEGHYREEFDDRPKHAPIKHI